MLDPDLTYDKWCDTADLEAIAELDDRFLEDNGRDLMEDFREAMRVTRTTTGGISDETHRRRKQFFHKWRDRFDAFFEKQIQTQVIG